MELNKHKAGLTLGLFAGLWHLVWGILVAIGAAQPLLDWLHSLHFLSSPHFVGGFSVGAAILLILVTSLFGYLFGWVLACLWNAVLRK